MLGRLRTDLDKLIGILQPMGPDEWTGFMVPHFYMGPVPAFGEHTEAIRAEFGA